MCNRPVCVLCPGRQAYGSPVDQRKPLRWLLMMKQMSDTTGDPALSSLYDMISAACGIAGRIGDIYNNTVLFKNTSSPESGRCY